MKGKYSISTITKVSDIEVPDRFFNRMKTGVEKLDEIFGGGILPGMTFTITAVAGGGKSTMCLQLLEALHAAKYKVAYLTGEEDVRQVAYNCRRLGVKNVGVSNEMSIEEIENICKSHDIIIIDSFPCVETELEMPKEKREKHIVNKLIEYGEKYECAVGLILHLTKSGQYKGSTYIPHAVGANFQINIDEDCDEYRSISSSKNRYGRTCEFSFLFQSTGFDFSSSRAAPVKGKSNSDKELEDSVLTLAQTDELTKESLIENLGVSSSKAYTLLKKLTESKKIKKEGRGASAHWVLIN